MDIFISYRRDDSGIAARWLHQELAARWGAEAVFMDIDDVGYGDDFAAIIGARLAQADVVLVVVGPRWHELIDQRQRGDDWVRHEVAQALALRQASGGRRPRVLPVQLDGTVWPGPALPPDIAPLQRLNAPKLRQSQLKSDLNELLQAVQGRSFEAMAGELHAERQTLGATAVAVAGLALALFFAAWLALFDLANLDTRVAGATVAAVAGPAPAGASPVVLVAIDASTQQALGRRLDASWRREHAQLVQQVARAGARVLAFDLFLPAAGDPAADAALVQALQAVRGRLPVVLAVDKLQDGQPALAPALAPLVGRGLGCAGKRLGRAALMPLAVQRGGAAAASPLLPSLALAAYNGGAPVDRLDPVALQVQVSQPPSGGRAMVDFYATETVVTPQSECPLLQPGDMLALQWVDPQPFLTQGGPQRLAYQDVLAGQPQALQALAGKTVLVGLTLDGEDRFALAASGQVVWGSELIAAQVDAMQRGRPIRPLGAVAQGLLMLLLAAAGALLALRLRGRPRWQRALAWTLAAGAVVAGAGGWYALEGQVVGVHHGLLALGCGAAAALGLARRARRRPSPGVAPLPALSGEPR